MCVFLLVSLCRSFSKIPRSLEHQIKSSFCSFSLCHSPHQYFPQFFFLRTMFRIQPLVSVLLCCFTFWFHISFGYLITCSGIVPMSYRNDKVSITDFGGVGDGKTLNTKAFRAAIYRIQHLRRRGGTLLYVPPGVYLTESFNLTSHMTLYLARGAVIKATQVLSQYLFPFLC